MSRYKVGDRVLWHGNPATIVPTKELGSGFDHLIRTDERCYMCYGWEGLPEGHGRYVHDSELTPLPNSSVFTVVQKGDNGYLRSTPRPAVPYTYDTAIDAAREYAKDGNEYLVLKAVASVKIPQVEPVVTIL